MSIVGMVDAAIQRHRDDRARREKSAVDWERRKEAVLADPVGRIAWDTMARHHLSLSSRTPVYGWQVERVYVMACEDLIAALTETERSSDG